LIQVKALKEYVIVMDLFMVATIALQTTPHNHVQIDPVYFLSMQYIPGLTAHD